MPIRPQDIESEEAQRGAFGNFMQIVGSGNLFDDEGKRDITIENLDEHFPGLKEFYDNTLEDPQLLAALEILTKQDIDGSEPSDGGYTKAYKSLEQLTEGNPNLFKDINAIIDQPGAREFIINAAKNHETYAKLLPSQEGELSAGAAGLVADLGQIAKVVAADPGMIQKINYIMEQPGAPEGLLALRTNEEALKIVKDFTGKDFTGNEPMNPDNLKELLDTVYQTLGGNPDTPGQAYAPDDPNAQGSPNAFMGLEAMVETAIPALQSRDGYDDLMKTLADKPEMRAALASVLGSEGTDISSVIKSVTQLSAYTNADLGVERTLKDGTKVIDNVDPDLLENINEILNADGADAFFAELQSNEALAEMIGGMSNGTMGDPKAITALVDGLKTRIDADPDYLHDVTNFLHNSKGALATIGEHANGAIKSPADALKYLDKGMGMHDMMTQLKDGRMLAEFGTMMQSVMGDKFDMSGLLSGLQDILGPLMEKLGGLLGGFGLPEIVVADPDGPGASQHPLIKELGAEGNFVFLEQDGQEIEYGIRGRDISAADQEKLKAQAVAEKREIEVNIDEDRDGDYDRTMTFSPT